jgi:hypothetical protein
VIQAAAKPEWVDSNFTLSGQFFNFLGVGILRAIAISLDIASFAK